MFIHPMHTPEYYFSTYNQLTVLQYYNIVSSVLSPSDLCMLRNLRKKTHARKSHAELTAKLQSEFHSERIVAFKFTRTL